MIVPGADADHRIYAVQCCRDLLENSWTWQLIFIVVLIRKSSIGRRVARGSTSVMQRVMKGTLLDTSTLSNNHKSAGLHLAHCPARDERFNRWVPVCRRVVNHQ